MAVSAILITFTIGTTLLIDVALGAQTNLAGREGGPAFRLQSP
jgi:hypothetical protein